MQQWTAGAATVAPVHTEMVRAAAGTSRPPSPTPAVGGAGWVR